MYSLLTSEELPAVKAVLGMNAQEEVRKMTQEGVLEGLHEFVREAARDMIPSS